MEHFAVLSYPKIFHNLKAAVKEACTGAKIQHIYYEDVQIPGSVMSEIVREKEFGRLPAYMQHAAEEALRVTSPYRGRTVVRLHH